MDQIAIMKQALEALKKCREGFEYTRQYVGYETLPATEGWSWYDGDIAAQAAISALNQAIEKAEQIEPIQPVTYHWRRVLPGMRPTDPWDSARIADYNEGWNDCQKKTVNELEKLYTTAPPPRQPLTDEEIDRAMGDNKQMLIDAADDYWKMRRAYARIIEAAHGIKGEA